MNRIHEINLHVLPAMQRHLSLKGYSPSTIRTYCNEMAQFLYILKSVPADSLTPDRIKSYMQFCHDKLKLKESTLHSRINTLKFYYEQVLGRAKFFWEIPRPKKQHLLPKLISKEKIGALINSIENQKHKTIIMLTYVASMVLVSPKTTFPFPIPVRNKISVRLFLNARYFHSSVMLHNNIGNNLSAVKR